MAHMYVGQGHSSKLFCTVFSLLVISDIVTTSLYSTCIYLYVYVQNIFWEMLWKPFNDPISLVFVTNNVAQRKCNCRIFHMKLINLFPPAITHKQVHTKIATILPSRNTLKTQHANLCVPNGIMGNLALSKGPFVLSGALTESLTPFCCFSGGQLYSRTCAAWVGTHWGEEMAIGSHRADGGPFLSMHTL